jgi:hypothetical protein
LAVVTCDSYADLKKQLGWLGTQVGQPGLAAMLEAVLLMATQGRGLAGLDVKRPLGAVLTTDGNDIAVHGFVPVKSLDKLLDSLQAVTGPTEQSGNTRSLTLPNGIAIDVEEQDGWAIVSPQGIDVEAVDKNGAKVIKQEKRVFNRFTDGRRQMQKSKEQEYEINWVGDMNFTTWVSRAKLVAARPGRVKLLKHCDERIAA